MLNHITLMGRMVRDPELRYTQSQTPVASFTLAVDRDFTDKSTGERGVDFINCTAWRSTAEFTQKYFFRGDLAVVSGRLQMREYTDKQGQKRTAAEVVAEHIYFGQSKQSGTSETRGRTTVVPKDIEAGDWEELDDGDGLPF